MEQSSLYLAIETGLESGPAAVQQGHADQRNIMVNALSSAQRLERDDSSPTGPLPFLSSSWLATALEVIDARGGVYNSFR
ncbi:hypothetical protein NM688_g4868 [Phlebia brevispora]|uniref:Uncharacterized protein n=1 Tax=Phlebia brevispora TaxID=194682 RepID=A0ACC1T1N7_9APHY|nr:hypothetical protein NM688_g4868 [Phlebia brevispora]